MDVPNPNRLLVLGSAGCDALRLVRELTGSAPVPVDDSIAGLIHAWPLTTKYYTAEIPVWIDQVHDLDAWTADFLTAEAGEVVRALGGWVYCFAKPVDEGALTAVRRALAAFAEVIERASEGGEELVRVAVAMPQAQTPQLQVEAERWEDLCQEHGFEFVDMESTGRNQFGELTGIPRLREALEANDWAGADVDDDLVFDDEESEGDEDDMAPFTGQRGELREALSSLRAEDDGEEDDGTAEEVEHLEKMMLKMTALRDIRGSIPEAQRKTMAKDVVQDFLKSPG